MLPSPSRLQARPPGLLTFGATSAFACATAWGLASIPKLLLSMGFRESVSLLPAIQATRLLTPPLAGLSPAEHASLCWTHNRTCGFHRLRLSAYRSVLVLARFPLHSTAIQRDFTLVSTRVFCPVCSIRWRPSPCTRLSLAPSTMTPPTLPGDLDGLRIFSFPWKPPTFT